MNEELVTVTVEMAQRWLDTAAENTRKLDPVRVAKYANALKLGRWKVNGEVIKFKDGRLFDGQHRLHAVVVSGCSFQTLITDIKEQP
jgi:hypothetical protein